MKEYSIRGVINREARNKYQCQCKQQGCHEIIEKGQQYALFKIVVKLQGERKNQERKISHDCAWYKKWREFLE